MSMYKREGEYRAEVQQLRAALDAKDTEIRATLDGLADSADRWYANYEVFRKRAEQAEARITRVKAARKIHAVAHPKAIGGCAACHMAAALDQPDDQPKGT